MGRGLVPPGYKYLGPFNSLDLGDPTNYNDAVAQTHDIGYKRLQEQEHINPYITYNDADEEFLQKLQPDDIPTYVAKGIFTTKKALSKVGILKHHTSKKVKMPRLRRNETSSWFSSKAADTQRAALGLSKDFRPAVLPMAPSTPTNLS